MGDNTIFPDAGMTSYSFKGGHSELAGLHLVKVM